MVVKKCVVCGKKEEVWIDNFNNYNWKCKKCSNSTKIFLLMLLALCVLLIPLVSSQGQFFKQNDVVDIKVECIINGTYCSNTASCQLNILYVNNSLFVGGGIMTYQTTYFNYTLPFSSVLGYYKCSATCCQDGLCNVGNCDFNITPSGLESSTSNALYYFGALFMFILFLAGNVFLIWKAKKPWLKLLFVSLSYLTFIALSFVTWQISANFITTIPFIQTILYFIWFMGLILFLPFIFISGLWLLDMASKEADVKKKVGMGYSEEEARNGYK